MTRTSTATADQLALTTRRSPLSDAPAPLARCQDCGRILTTALTICDPCLAAARKVIADIRDYLRQLPDATTSAGRRPSSTTHACPSPSTSPRTASA